MNNLENVLAEYLNDWQNGVATGNWQLGTTTNKRQDRNRTCLSARRLQITAIGKTCWSRAPGPNSGFLTQCQADSNGTKLINHERAQLVTTKSAGRRRKNLPADRQVTDH